MATVHVSYQLVRDYRALTRTIVEAFVYNDVDQPTVPAGLANEHELALDGLEARGLGRVLADESV